MILVEGQHLASPYMGRVGKELVRGRHSPIHSPQVGAESRAASEAGYLHPELRRS